MNDSELVREAIALLGRSRKWIKDGKTKRPRTPAEREAYRTYMREYMREYRARQGPVLRVVVRIRPGFCSRCGDSCEVSPCPECRHEITKEIAS